MYKKSLKGQSEILRLYGKSLKSGIMFSSQVYTAVMLGATGTMTTAWSRSDKMIDQRLYKVTNGSEDYFMIRETIRREDEAGNWSKRTGFNRMCYDCKRDCKTKNHTWSGCVKKEVKR